VGALQLDVLAARIKSEYDLAVRLEPAPYETARWVEGGEAEVTRFIEGRRAALAADHDNAPVFLARNKWELDTTIKEWPGLAFKATREQI
jgi:peptide chain release factor 3